MDSKHSIVHFHFWERNKTWRTATEIGVRFLDEINRVWPDESTLGNEIITANKGGSKTRGTLKADGKNLVCLGLSLLGHGPTANAVKNNMTLDRMSRAEHIKDPTDLDKLNCSVIHNCFIIPVLAVSLEVHGKYPNICKCADTTTRNLHNIMCQCTRKFAKSGTWSSEFVLHLIEDPDFEILDERNHCCKGVCLPHLQLFSLFGKIDMTEKGDCIMADDEELEMVNKDYNGHLKFNTFVPTRNSATTNHKRVGIAEMKNKRRRNKPVII